MIQTESMLDPSESSFLHIIFFPVLIYHRLFFSLNLLIKVGIHNKKEKWMPTETESLPNRGDKEKKQRELKK